MAVRNANYYDILIYHRLENSSEYHTIPTKARVRVANNLEISKYQVLSGAITKLRGVFLYSQDFPKELKNDDRVVFLNREYLVESVGVYLNESNLLGQHRFSNEYIIKKSPKGIKLV